jgi:hypothetical protein
MDSINRVGGELRVRGVRRGLLRAEGGRREGGKVRPTDPQCGPIRLDIGRE